MSKSASLLDRNASRDESLKSSPANVLADAPTRAPSTDFMASLSASEVQLSALDAALVMFRSAVSERDQGSLHQRAADGMRGPSSSLPHMQKLQASFGRHDLSGVRAYTGANAQAAARSLGAHAYAADGNVVLGATGQDLHTVAHEAAHVVQQRGGVQLQGGVGQSGDVYERHADAVADAVVAGRSAEGLLDQMAPAVGRASAGVQRLQLKEAPKKAAIDAMTQTELEELIPTGENGWKGETKAADVPEGYTKEDIDYAKKRLKKLVGSQKLKQGGAQAPKSHRKGTEIKATSQQTYHDDGRIEESAKKERFEDGRLKSGAGEAPVRDPSGNTAAEPTGPANREKGKAGKALEKLADKTDVKADATLAKVSKSAKAEAALAEYNGTWQLSDNFKATMKAKFGAVEANAKVGAEVGGDAKAGTGGVSGSTAVGASAKALDFDLKVHGGWHVPLLGKEKARVGLYAGVAAMAGVEAAGEVKAGAGKMAGQTPSAKPEVGAMVGAKGEAFAGAKAKIYAGVQLDWDKKAQASYKRELTQFLEYLMVPLSALGGPLGVGLNYLRKELLGNSVEAVLADVIGYLYDWGPSGKVPLIMAEVTGEGTAGAGAKGEVAAGFKKGQIQFKADGSLTVGLGGGFGVTVSLDAVQFPIFCMVQSGILLPYIKAEAMDRLEKWLRKYTPDSVADLIEDDVAEAKVDAGLHTDMSASQRASLIDKMVDARVGGSTETAIIDILKASKEKGDQKAVVSAMNTSMVSLCDAIDGDNFHVHLNNALVGLDWCTKVGELKYPYGGEVFMDDRECGPYVYFQESYNANWSDDRIGPDSEVRKSYSDNYNWYVCMPGFHRHAKSFYKLDCNSNEDLVARFRWISKAYEYREGGGIWPENP